MKELPCLNKGIFSLLSFRYRKALAKRTRKSTQVLDLPFVWPPTCVELHRLATTYVDLRGLWSSSNLHASRRKFFTVWPPSASRHKLIARNLLLYKRFNQWYAWNLRKFIKLNLFTKFRDGVATCEPTCEPFGHPSQVRTQVLLLQTCVDLRRLASPFGQGLIWIHNIWKDHETMRTLEQNTAACLGRLLKM